MTREEKNRKRQLHRKNDPTYRERHNAEEKRRYAKNKKKIRAQIRYRTYGLTPEQHEALLQAQSGACAICFRAVPLTVDHCHKTGEVRGLLCNNCNPLLGMAKDQPEVILRAVEYLRKYSIDRSETP